MKYGDKSFSEAVLAAHEDCPHHSNMNEKEANACDRCQVATALLIAIDRMAVIEKALESAWDHHSQVFMGQKKEISPTKIPSGGTP